MINQIISHLLLSWVALSCFQRFEDLSISLTARRIFTSCSSGHLISFPLKSSPEGEEPSPNLEGDDNMFDFPTGK